MRYLSRFLQPDTLPATTPPAADYMINSSDVLRRVHSKWHASTMFCMSCKGGAVCHVKVGLRGKQRHLIMSKLTINVNLETAVTMTSAVVITVAH